MFIYSYPPKASNNLIGSPFILASKYVSLIFLLRRLAIFQRQCEIQGKQIIKWLMFYQIQNVYSVALHTRSIIKVQSVQSTTYGCFVWLRRHFPLSKLFVGPHRCYQDLRSIIYSSWLYGCMVLVEGQRDFSNIKLKEREGSVIKIATVLYHNTAYINTSYVFILPPIYLAF